MYIMTPSLEKILRTPLAAIKNVINKRHCEPYTYVHNHIR